MKITRLDIETNSERSQKNETNNFCEIENLVDDEANRTGVQLWCQLESFMVRIKIEFCPILVIESYTEEVDFRLQDGGQF